MRVADDPFADIEAPAASPPPAEIDDGNARLDEIPPPDHMPDNVVAMFPGEDDAARAAPVEDTPLPGVHDPANWDGKHPPDRRFIIPGWLVRGAAGLLSGMEGVGKSLIAQQLATCAAVGRPFLGLAVEHVNAVYVTCEDPVEELWRRQESINAALGVTMADIAGRLLLVSLCGELGNELGTFSAEGLLSPSLRYRQIEKQCTDFGAHLAILDNAAHMFPGNENARHDVAAFLGLLERLSRVMDGAALLLAHPNKQHAQGNKQGNEYSGSTGWSAHVRNRLFLDYLTETDDGAPVDDDERVLRKSKANYGKRGEEVTFRWHQWAFVKPDDIPDDSGREMTANVRANGENARFIECLDKATRERRTVSARPAAPNYAPKVFAKMTVAKKMSALSFGAAMERLLHLGEIVGDGRVFKRDNRTWAMGIVRSEGAQSVHKALDEEDGALCKNDSDDNELGTAQSVNGDFCTKRAQSCTLTPHRSALHSTPSTTYIGEPLGGSPSMYEPAGEERFDDVPPIDCGDFRDNPLFDGGR